MHCISPLDLLPAKARRAAAETECARCGARVGDGRVAAKQEPSSALELQPALSVRSADDKAPMSGAGAKPECECAEAAARAECPEATASPLSRLTLFWFIEYVYVPAATHRTLTDTSACLKYNTSI